MGGWPEPHEGPHRVGDLAVIPRLSDHGAVRRVDERDPVLAVSSQVADVTGDRSADAIVFAERGGSGGCGVTLVVDLATGTEVFREEGCDRRVDPSSDPVGLTVTEAVYAPGDPHCCPSSVRTTTLVYADGAWTQASSTTSPA